MSAHDAADPSTLLRHVRDGDAVAQEQLFALLYDDLRRMAVNLMRAERPDHTLQPTALVHEAVLRLFRPESLDHVQSLSHARALVAQVMHRVLVDHARTTGRDKRGGDRRRAPLDDATAGASDNTLATTLDLAEALADFGAIDERACTVVKLRYYGGLTNEDVAGQLGVSLGTVEGDLRIARAWLRRRLGDAAP